MLVFFVYNPSYMILKKDVQLGNNGNRVNRTGFSGFGDQRGGWVREDIVYSGFSKSVIFKKFVILKIRDFKNS